MSVRVPVFSHSFPTTVCSFSGRDENPSTKVDVVVHSQIEKEV